MNQLVIYYDTPNDASDMYLKMIQKDAVDKNVKIDIISTTDKLHELVGQYRSENTSMPILALEPNTIDINAYCNTPSLHTGLENVDGSNYASATATGIFKQIRNTHPERDTTIVVIGRGLVGNQLLNMLIKHGYTVIEINSKTPPDAFASLIPLADIIVGLSSADDILNEDQRNSIALIRKISNKSEPWYIDAARNFNFTDRKTVSKCGKWTRDVLFERILSL